MDLLMIVNGLTTSPIASPPTHTRLHPLPIISNHPMRTQTIQEQTLTPLITIRHPPHTIIPTNPATASLP
jgi:hypothetical protein